jgi:uncharacterized protein YbjT (DUF2867 family)
MVTGHDGVILVTGATGLQGGAVANQLLTEGWQVRALTRNINGRTAQALAARGAEVVQGDLADVKAVWRAIDGAYGVYSVQNPFTSSIEDEIRQGKAVADGAREAGVRHIVYGSAGSGARDTGIPSWESKLVIEAHMQALGLPLTILRPTAFMELMTARQFFPSASTWHVMPAIMGSHRAMPWLSAADLGVIAARVFTDPNRFVGQELTLASDVQTIGQCRALYEAVLGRKPPRFPMPVWLFECFGFVGKDLTTMWRWLRDNEVPLDTKPARAIYPEALTVRDWLRTQRR